MPGRRYNCACGKKRYRDEESALAAAAADVCAHGGEVTPYRCPGGLAWHLTSRGFTPEALPTAGRRLAFALLEHGELDLDAVTGRDPRRARRLLQCAEQMTALGLAGRRDGRLVAVDRTGLARVVRIGLDGYAEERVTG